MEINCSQFYSEIVNTNRPIREIFAQLSISMNTYDFEKLSDEFSDQLEENFDSLKKGQMPFNNNCRFKLPKQIFKRVRLATMILSSCSLGAKFDDNLYQCCLDYIVIRELCFNRIYLS